MAFPELSQRKAEILSNGVFLIALGVLFYTNSWWPGIIVAIWLLLSVRQLFTGAFKSFVITTIIFTGLMITVAWKVDWGILMPAIFIGGGALIIVRELFYSGKESDGDKN